MTVVGTAFFFLYVGCAILILSILVGILRRDMHQDRDNGVGGVSSLETLPWGGWTPSKGWPPMTCWPACRDFHRDDWWRVYLDRTCWHGCSDLHRDDWWRAYVDQADGTGRKGATEEPDPVPVSAVSAGRQRPGRKKWAGRPVLLNRTADRDRAAI